MAQELPLARAVERFLAEHNMSPVTFGRRAMNDPHFVRDITAEKPRRVWPETEQKVRQYMAAYSAAEQVAA